MPHPNRPVGNPDSAVPCACGGPPSNDRQSKGGALGTNYILLQFGETNRCRNLQRTGVFEGSAEFYCPMWLLNASFRHRNECKLASHLVKLW